MVCLHTVLSMNVNLFLFLSKVVIDTWMGRVFFVKKIYIYISISIRNKGEQVKLVKCSELRLSCADETKTFFSYS